MSSAWLWVSFLAATALSRSAFCAATIASCRPWTSLLCALATSASEWPPRSLVAQRALAQAEVLRRGGGCPAPKAGRERRPRAAGPAEAQRAVGDVVDVRLEVGEDVVGLALGELLVGHGLVEVGLRGVEDRLLEAGEVLALRLGDVGQRLAVSSLVRRSPRSRPRYLAAAASSSPRNGLPAKPGPPGPPGPAGPEPGRPGPPRTPSPASMRAFIASACALVMRPAARSALTWSIGGRLGGVLELLRADPEVLGHGVQEVRPARAGARRGDRRARPARDDERRRRRHHHPLRPEVPMRGIEAGDSKRSRRTHTP